MDELDARAEQQDYGELDGPAAIRAQLTMIEDLISTLEAQQRAIYRLAERVRQLEQARGSI